MTVQNLNTSVVPLTGTENGGNKPNIDRKSTWQGFVGELMEATALLKSKQSRPDLSLLTRLVEGARERIKKAHVERMRIVALSLRCEKRHLECSMLALEMNIGALSRELSVRRQNRDLNLELKRVQNETMEHSECQKLVPSLSSSLIEDALQIEFVANSCEVKFVAHSNCMQWYIPGETIHITADASSGVIDKIQFLDIPVSNSLSDSDSRYKDECKALLKEEMKLLQSAAVELDVSVVVYQLLIFLSRLDMHYMSATLPQM